MLEEPRVEDDQKRANSFANVMAPSLSFDVALFLQELAQMLHYVHARLKTGQTDVESARMEGHIQAAVLFLRSAVFRTDPRGLQSKRLVFWEGCKQLLDPVYNHREKKPRGSRTLQHLYDCLFQLQLLVLRQPAESWFSASRPAGDPPYPREVSRPNAAATYSGSWFCDAELTTKVWAVREGKRILTFEKRRCSHWSGPEKSKCKCCGVGHQPVWAREAYARQQSWRPLGPNDVWRWKNPPKAGV